MKQRHSLTTLRITAGMFLFGSAAMAAPIAYEGFDSDPGELDFSSGATSFGWNEEWFSFDGTNTVQSVADGGLTYAGLDSVGNAMVFELEANFNAAATYRMLPTFIQMGVSTGQVWISALMQPNWAGDPAGGGFFQLALSDGIDPYNKGYIGTPWAGTVYATGGERTDEDNVLTDIPIEQGVTALVVVQVDFDAGIMNFWVNPDPGVADPGTPNGVATLTNSGDSIFQFDRIMLWAGHWGPADGNAGADFVGTMVDEIRLGESYDDVTPGAVAETWGGFPVETYPAGKFAFTGNFMGALLLDEASDWVYSYKLAKWVYFPEPAEGAGGWCYIRR